MAKQVIHCPGCKQSLDLPEEFIGRNVKCPGCARVFTAAVDAPEAAVTTTPPPLKDDADDRPRSRRRDDDDEDADVSIKKRRKSSSGGGKTYFDQLTQRYRPREPHRAMLIMTLGVMSFIPCIGIFLGPMAYYMGSQDLNEMNDGRMDPSGAQLTNIGRFLGIAGLGLFVLTFVGFCCLGILGAGGR
jgi:hypothetical protein